MTARERKLRRLVREAITQAYLRGCAEARAELDFKSGNDWRSSARVAKVHRRVAREAARQAREEMGRE